GAGRRSESPTSGGSRTWPRARSPGLRAAVECPQLARRSRGPTPRSRGEPDHAREFVGSRRPSPARRALNVRNSPVLELLRRRGQGWRHAKTERAPRASTEQSLPRPTGVASTTPLAGPAEPTTPGADPRALDPCHDA